MEKEKLDIIIAKLDRAYYSSNHYRDRIYNAKILLEAGFVEKMLDNVFIKNIINLLAPFIQNSKVKEAIRLLQDGLEEERQGERKIARGKPAIKRLKSDLDDFHVEIYKNDKNEMIQKCFTASENAWKVTDINGYYIYFETEQKAIDYRQKLFDRYKVEGKIFQLEQVQQAQEVSK